MQQINIQFRNLNFPVITNDETLDKETIELGLDCLLPSQELIPTGIELILVDCLNIDENTQWTLHFAITDQDPDDPDFARDFASDIKDHILSNEEGLPTIDTIVNNDYGTVTIIYHAG